MVKKKYIITFAGPVGSSKTPISNYLSTKLGLPVYNNDSVRTEVLEDLGEYNEDEFLRRRDERIKYILEARKSFILDVSIDRIWKEYKEKIKEMGYEIFIISLDLSKEFLTKLYKIKGYFESLEKIDENMNDHKIFLENFSEEISISIDDKNFLDRLDKSHRAIQKWVSPDNMD
ncbi:MAG: hypothetical protein PF572_04435 [Patescibacteria group bacterium]|jgi:2-hydroxy-3-keto-5-methylthiopentenyl-1-phosphate phosphatase|nr:hypothetical protein [Patescibacteria group bacterium]